MTPNLEFGCAMAAKPGEKTCGDTCLTSRTQGQFLLAVADGLGHGTEAAQAATIARATLLANAGRPLVDLVVKCHQALRGSRGVVMSLAYVYLREALLLWLGVGNVQGMLLRRRSSIQIAEEPLALRTGVVGLELPPLQVRQLPILPGDAIVFVTDGVAADFERALAFYEPPSRAAEAILTRNVRATDDALVAIARYAEVAREERSHDGKQFR